MIGYRKILRYACYVIIILCIGSTIIPPSCTAQTSMGTVNVIQNANNSQSKHGDNDDYNFFSFAIIWGSFEILDFNGFFAGTQAHNPSPYNRTMYVIGWVDYEHKFIFKTSYYITVPWRIGFVDHHKLFIIAWGEISAF